MASPIRNAHRRARHNGERAPLRAYVRGILARPVNPHASDVEQKLRRDAGEWAARKGLGTWSHGLEG